jgi:hypothetical protein
MWIKQIPDDVVTAALHTHGVPDVAALQNSPGSIPAIAAELGLTVPF